MAVHVDYYEHSQYSSENNYITQTCTAKQKRKCEPLKRPQAFFTIKSPTSLPEREAILACIR